MQEVFENWQFEIAEITTKETEAALFRFIESPRFFHTLGVRISDVITVRVGWSRKHGKLSSNAT